MEWATVQHLDLRHAGGRRGASARPLQPHAAAFRASQAIVAVAIGTHVVGKTLAQASPPSVAAADLGRTVLELVRLWWRKCAMSSNCSFVSRAR
jgi:hypothetical protein